MDVLNKFGVIDEDHGLLTIDSIKKSCTEVFKKYHVQFAYLFGSYAKGKAKDTSDVDLLIDTSITGIKYYDLVEELREALNKKIDLLNVDQLLNNKELLINILKDGIKIYGY